MPNELAVVGTADLDDITTPFGRSDGWIPGGSAIYVALAAAPAVPVRICGIVGADAVDGVRGMVAGLPIDLSGLEISDLPASRWVATHHPDGTTTDHFSSLGATGMWRPRLTEAAAGATMLMLGSMDPERQRAVLTQSRAGVVGLDTMTTFTSGADREVVLALTRGVDLLFVNLGELATLADEPTWQSAATALLAGRLRTVVVKRGHLGAALVTRDGVTEVPAVPVNEVIDPTGAGDALAGGMLGALADAADPCDPATQVAALGLGTAAAAATLTGFGMSMLREAALTAHRG